MTPCALHAHSLFLRFTFQTANEPPKRHHPYCLSRPRVGPSPSSLLAPLDNTRGMARQVAQPLFFVAVLPLESTAPSPPAITPFSFLPPPPPFLARSL